MRENLLNIKHIKENVKKGKILHIVCGISNDYVYTITAYYPDETRWKEDMRSRRKK